MDDSLTCLSKLETAIGAAPNTKTDIKQIAKELGVVLREFFKMAKALGATRSPDQTEQQLQVLQLQQQQQHQQTLDSNEHIRNTLVEVQTTLAAYDTRLLTLAISAPDRGPILVDGGTVTGRPPDPQPWTEVVKRSARKREKRTKTASQSQETVQTKPITKRRVPKAILVKRGERTFSETVQELKSKVNVEVTGGAISRMRETRTGDLLIEMEERPNQRLF